MVILIFLVIVISLFVDFKSTVLFYAPFKFLFTNDVVLVGSISFDNAISLLICGMYLFHFYVRREYINYKDTWPLMLSFVFMALSESVAALIGEPNVASIPLKFCRNYGYCLVMYNIISAEKDFETVYNSLFFFVMLLVGNGIVQFLTGINIIGDWLLENMKDNTFFAGDTDYGERGTRINSFMGHSICFGDVCAIFFLIYIYLYLSDYMKRKSLIMMFLLVIGVVLSNSRTPLLALMIYMIPVVTRKDYIERYRYVYLLCIPILLFLFFTPVYHMLDSMFNEDSIYDTGGSSMSMRLEQTEATIDVVETSMIWGLGYSFDFEGIDELKGAESVWFNILMYQGVLGCICYIFIIVQSLVNTRSYSNYKFICFMAIGYFVQQSSTYNAGLNEFLFYFCLIIMLTHSYLFLDNKQQEFNSEIIEQQKGDK